LKNPNRPFLVAVFLYTKGFDMKKLILSSLTLCALATTPVFSDFTQQVGRDFLYDSCEETMRNGMKQRNIKVNADYAHIIRTTCNCYADKMIEKIDWNKINNMPEAQVDAYVAGFEPSARTECAEQMKNQVVHNPSNTAAYERGRSQGNNYSHKQHNSNVDSSDEWLGRLMAGIIFAGVFSLLAWLISKGLKNISGKDKDTDSKK